MRKGQVLYMRVARERMGISQAELAWRTGIHQSDVCRIELGRHEPYRGQRARLAKALRIRPSSLTKLVPLAA